MSLIATNRITIDLTDTLTIPVVRAVQEDVSSRYVEITLVSNGEPLDIPVGTHGMIGIRRPNLTYVLYDADENGNDAVTFDGNIATAYLSQEALAVAGSLYMSVSLYDGDARLTAFHIMVDVECTAVPSGVVAESDYFNILESMIDSAVDAANRAETAAASVIYAVKYTEQTLSSSEQAQARTNIGAMAANAAPTPAGHHTTHEAEGSDPITLPTASTSAAGIVQLYDGVDSSSTTLAATAAAVKTVYDSIASPTIITSSESGSVSINKDTWTKLASVELTAGVWIVSAYASLIGNSDASTKRQLCISDTVASDARIVGGAQITGRSAEDGRWMDTLTIFIDLSATTTVYLNVNQSASSSISTSVYGIRAMKL